MLGKHGEELYMGERGGGGGGGGTDSLEVCINCKITALKAKTHRGIQLKLSSK